MKSLLKMFTAFCLLALTLTVNAVGNDKAKAAEDKSEASTAEEASKELQNKSCDGAGGGAS